MTGPCSKKSQGSLVRLSFFKILLVFICFVMLWEMELRIYLSSYMNIMAVLLGSCMNVSH